MTAPTVTAWAIKAPGVFLAVCILLSGCITANEEDTTFNESVVVLDRIDFTGFGSGQCACVVSTAAGDSKYVAFHSDCAKLVKGTNVTLMGDLRYSCPVRRVKVQITEMEEGK